MCVCVCVRDELTWMDSAQRGGAGVRKPPLVGGRPYSSATRKDTWQCADMCDARLPSQHKQLECDQRHGVVKRRVSLSQRGGAGVRKPPLLGGRGDESRCALLSSLLLY